jgi:hypothetical protein
MWTIQFVGVTVTVLAQGAKVVYSLRIYESFDPVIVNAPDIAPSLPSQ